MNKGVLKLGCLAAFAGLALVTDGLAQPAAGPPANSSPPPPAAGPRASPAPSTPAAEPKSAGREISIPLATVSWCLAPFADRITMFERLAGTTTWPKMTPAERQANYHTGMAVHYDIPAANPQRRYEAKDHTSAEEGWWLDTGHKLQLRAEYRLFDLVRLGPQLPAEGEVARRSMLQMCWMSGPLSNWRWVGEAALGLPQAVPMAQFPSLAGGYQIETAGKGEYVTIAWGDAARGAPSRVMFRFAAPLTAFTGAETYNIHLSDGPSPQKVAPAGAREMTQADFLKLLETPSLMILEGMPTRNATDPDGKWDAKGAG